MQIREYNEADEGAVIALWEQCGMIVPWNDPRKDIARKLRVGRELFLIGVLDNRVIASVMGGYDGHRGWIYYMAVAPDFQQHGYGREIMEAMETRLIKRGCPKINLQVRAHNRKVIAFYESLGYKESDLISMGKRLEDDEPNIAGRPGVKYMEQKRKILPPVYLLLTLAAMAALHYGLPLAQLISPPFSYAGALFIVAGISIAAAAALSFRRAGTPVIPFEPSTALVTGGLYRYTRNPMYLGMVSALAGAAMLFGTLSVWLPVAVFISIIRNNFILGEERFLKEIFGKQYTDYQNKVGRWL